MSIKENQIANQRLSSNFEMVTLEIIRPEKTKDDKIFGYVPSVRIGKVEVWFTCQYCYLIMPYNRKIMDRLKRIIPRAHREWLPEVKKWRISRVCDDGIYDFLVSLEPRNGKELAK